ncbi:hypothetical protein ACFL55_01750 [Candidatus Latescibacterota bacterium]
MAFFYYTITRRTFVRTSAAAALGFSAAPYLNCGKASVITPLKRPFARLRFEVTTLGLGGQASLRWPSADVDPVAIIFKACKLGINYFDTSNLSGPSQSNYGKAFSELDLIPGQPGYNEPLRQSLFLTGKTHLRFAKGGWEDENIHNATDGPEGSHAVDDLKRTISIIFGDGKGGYPTGAYLDMFLAHNIKSMAEIDALYEGLSDPDPRADHIGAFAALVDYRNGTNLTGLNPREERLIRHIGFSLHESPAVGIEMIQRDTKNILDGMLVAINPNDQLYFNMQHNVIPVASGKNMGVIGMKVFANGGIYLPDAPRTDSGETMVRSIGSRTLPSRPLIQYALTTPGIDTVIIGIGQIDDDAENCQLVQNLSAAQIAPDGFSDDNRRYVERFINAVKGGHTNYYQAAAVPLTPPREPVVAQVMREGQRIVRLTWQTAYAGTEPIRGYEIWRDGERIDRVLHAPQTDRRLPFAFEDTLADRATHTYHIVTIDASRRTASSEELLVESPG